MQEVPRDAGTGMGRVVGWAVWGREASGGGGRGVIHIIRWSQSAQYLSVQYADLHPSPTLACAQQQSLTLKAGPN